ncbi:MAG: hypothetical protein ACYTFA_18070 [Planctomycetota bacterium]
MVRRTAWMAIRKFAESNTAKVLRDLSGPLKTLSFAFCGLSLVAGFLWMAACLVLPPICDGVSFLWHNPVWIIPAVLGAMIAMGIAAVLLRAIIGDACSTTYPEYHGFSDFRHQVVSPCNGSIVSSFRDSLDCVRLDPFDECYRSEPCVGLSLGEQGFVNPLPKIGPCPDIVDDSGLIVDDYVDLLCIEVDPCEPCYRPVQC